MVTKYIVRFKSWRTHKYEKSDFLTFDEMVESFHLHVNNGEPTSIQEITI